MTDVVTTEKGRRRPGGPAGHVGPSASDVDACRRDYLRALDLLEEARAVVMERIRASQEALGVSRTHVSGGGRLADIVEDVGAGEVRALVADSIALLARARHRAQRASFRLLAAEGETLAEIARIYGVSRQLVSRMVNEPEPQDDRPVSHPAAPAAKLAPESGEVR